jgi:hypothetical protein
MVASVSGFILVCEFDLSIRILAFTHHRNNERLTKTWNDGELIYIVRCSVALLAAF